MSEPSILLGSNEDHPILIDDDDHLQQEPERDGHVIEVQPINEEESLTLLRARIPASQSGESGEDEKALVQALEFIPQAITSH